MNIINKHWLFSLALLTIATTSFGQKNSEKSYASKEYTRAAHYLEAKENRTVEDMEKIANSYRLNHNTETAEFWYKQIVVSSPNPLNILYYAQMLQSNGKLERAKERFLEYDALISRTNSEDERGKRLAEAIDHVMSLKMPGKVVVENAAELNTDHLDFSPSYVGSGIVFVSTRPEGNNEKLRDNWIGDNFMNLYHAPLLGQKNYGDTETFNKTINTDFHEGPVCISKTGDKVFFTRNQLEGGKKRKNDKDGLLRNDIYVATIASENQWEDIQEMPFNTEDYEEVHPSVTPDGKVLIFSSNRPGGFGGMDLYQVEYLNGKYTAPMNLGEEVNTAGNEIFPYIHDDNSLYFASDGWGGLGGLDVFKSRLENNQVSQKEPKNIGAPINSSKDDFGLILNVSGTEGYFTSARPGGFGKDDIYYFNMEEVKDEDLTDINVFSFEDKDTGEKLPNAKFKVYEINGPTGTQNLMKYFSEDPNSKYFIRPNTEGAPLEYLTSGSDGEFGVQLIKGREYLVRLERPGYDPIERKMTVDENGNLSMNGSFSMSKSSCLTIEGTVYDTKTNLPIPFADVVIEETCLGDKSIVRADENGYYTAPCSACNCEYKVEGNKIAYNKGMNSTGIITSKCNQGGVVKVDLNLIPIPDKIVVGTQLELKNIFYDFNKYNIRNDAANDLNELVRVMKKYPSMVIELSSHTDARGTDQYNNELSQNRAESAIQYLIKRGVEDYRLVAKGFGESKTRNHCGDGVKCSEEEHQFNRRTVVKILELSENVDVKVLDNFPIIIDKAPWHIRNK